MFPVVGCPAPIFCSPNATKQAIVAPIALISIKFKEAKRNGESHYSHLELTHIMVKGTITARTLRGDSYECQAFSSEVCPSNSKR